MKKLHLIFLLIYVAMISCKDNNDIEDTQPGYILAGVESNKLNIQSYSSELKISFKNETAGDIPTTVFSGDLLIDLDSDNTNDIKFHAYYGYGCSMAGECITKACELWNLNNNMIEICKTPLNAEDKISDQLTWSKLGPYSEGEELIVWSTNLSSYSPEWNNSEEVKNNTWTSDNLYLAIRIKRGDIYKYGWIKLNIDDFYDVKVKEIGFEI